VLNPRFGTAPGITSKSNESVVRLSSRKRWTVLSAEGLIVVGPPDGIEAGPAPRAHQRGQRPELQGRGQQAPLQAGRPHTGRFLVPTVSNRGHGNLLPVCPLGEADWDWLADVVRLPSLPSELVQGLDFRSWL
jgi:hypothetical protein